MDFTKKHKYCFSLKLAYIKTKQKSNLLIRENTFQKNIQHRLLIRVKITSNELANKNSPTKISSLKVTFLRIIRLRYWLENNKFIA